MSPAKHPPVTSTFIENVLAAHLGELSERYEGAAILFSTSEGVFKVLAHAGRRELTIARGPSEPEAACLAFERIQQRLFRHVYGREVAEETFGRTHSIIPSLGPDIKVPFAFQDWQCLLFKPSASTAVERHAQLTIGVSGSSTLWAAVGEADWVGGTSRAEKLRRLLTQGFNAIERRLDHERPDPVHAEVEEATRRFEVGKKRQVMLRLKPAVYNRIVVAAYNRHIALSKFCIECIAYALTHKSTQILGE